MKRIGLIFAASTWAVLLAAGAAIALNGVAPCVDTGSGDAKKELLVLPYAEDYTIGGGDCATVVSCVNLNKKDTHYHVEYFNGEGTMTGYAVNTLDPGRRESFTTRAGLPGGLLSSGTSTSAGTGQFEGFARVCGDSSKTACDAQLVCTLGGAVTVIPLNAIRKKQQGD